jgi:hypothetical protein
VERFSLVDEGVKASAQFSSSQCTGWAINLSLAELGRLRGKEKASKLWRRGNINHKASSSNEAHNWTIESAAMG